MARLTSKPDDPAIPVRDQRHFSSTAHSGITDPVPPLRPWCVPAQGAVPMTRHPVHKAPALRRLANWLRPGQYGGQPDDESRPAAEGTNVRLRDGSRVLIR